MSVAGTRDTRAAAKPPSVFSGQRLFVLSSLSIAHAFMHVVQQGYYVILPEVKAAFDLSPVQTGAVESARSLSNGLVNFPSGFASDLMRRQWALVVAVALGGVGAAFLVLGSAPNYAIAMVAAAMIGGTIAMWHPPAIAVLSAKLPERRGLALSIHGMGGNIGNALAPIVMGSLLAVMVWRNVAYVSAVPIILLGIVLWFTLRRSEGRGGKAGSVRAYIASVKVLLRNRSFIWLVASRSAMGMASTSIFTFFPIYLKEDLGLSALNIYTFFLMGSGTASQPFLGFFSDRYGRKLVIAPSLLLMAGSALALIWASPGIALAAAIIGVGLFIYAVSAIFQAAAVDISGTETSAAAVGLLTGISFLFVTVSPTIAGVLSRNYGNKAVFIYSAGLLVLATALVLPSHLAGSSRARGKGGKPNEATGAR